jgi:hypothetical protein
LERAAARLPKGEVAQAVSQVTRAVLARYGFVAPQVTVRPAADGVQARLGTDQACTATAGTEAKLTSVLRKGVPWLRSVQIVVGATNQSLSRYVRGHCRPVSLPTGSGTAVLTKQGSAWETTETFTVHSSRWSVDFINEGSMLDVVVVKGGVSTGSRFRAVGRGAGKRVLAGAGRISLRVAGTGDWVVRVRDGV